MSVAPWITDASTALPSVRTRTRRARGGAEVVPRDGVINRLLRQAIVFSVLSGVSYGFFSLMGHSLYNAAYKTRSNAETRTASARQDVLEVGRQLSAIVSTESLDRWARGHGFARPGALLATNYAAQTEQTNH